MPDLDRNYFVLQQAIQQLSPQVNFSGPQVSTAIRNALTSNRVISNPARQSTGEFTITPQLMRTIGRNLNVDWSNYSDNILNQGLQTLGQQFDEFHNAGTTLLMTGDPRASHYYLFNKLSNSNELNMANPIIGVTNDSLKNAFQTGKNGTEYFNERASRQFIAGNPDGSENRNSVVLSFAPYQDDAIALASEANNAEATRATNTPRYSTAKSDDDKSELERVQDAIGAYVSPRDMATVAQQLRQNPKIHYADDMLKASAKELQRLHDTGRSFSLRAGTKPGQFDAKLDTSEKASDRVLDAESPSLDKDGNPVTDKNGHSVMESNAQYVGRIYIPDAGYAYPTVNSRQPDKSRPLITASLIDFATGATKMIPVRNANGQPLTNRQGREIRQYGGLLPYMNVNGTVALSFNGRARDENGKTFRSMSPKLYFSPFANRNDDTKQQQKFLNNLRTNYSADEGTNVTTFYLAKARDNFFRTVSDSIDSDTPYIRNVQNAIRKFMGDNGAEGAMALHQFRPALKKNTGDEKPQDILQTFSMLDNADEFSANAFKELRAQSVFAQQKAAENVKDPNNQFGVPHKVAPDVLERATHDHDAFVKFTAQLSDDQKADLHELMEMINSQADHTIGKLAENPLDSTLEANRVQTFADFDNSGSSVRNDLWDALAVSPLHDNLIGEPYSQSLTKDHIVRFDTHSARNINDLRRQASRVAQAKNIIDTYAKGVINSPHVMVDKHNVISFTGENADGLSVSGNFDSKALNQIYKESNNFFKQAIEHPQFDPNHAYKITEYVQTHDNPQQAALFFNQISSLVSHSQNLDNVQLMIDDNKNIRFAGQKKDRDGSVTTVTGSAPQNQFASLITQQRTALNNSVRASMSNDPKVSIPFDNHSALDLKQLNELQSVLNQTRQHLYNVNVVGNNIKKTAVQYDYPVPDANNPSGYKLDENGHRVHDRGVNPDGISNNPLKYSQVYHRNIQVLPDVAIDSNGIIHYDAFRSAGMPFTDKLDEHGLKTVLHLNNQTRQWEVVPPIETTNADGTKSYQIDPQIESQARSSKNRLVKFQRIQSARFIPAIPVSGDVGQIFVPDENNVLKTRFNSLDDFATVPGNRAFIESVGSEEGFNHVQLSNRVMANNFMNLLFDHLRTQLNMQAVKTPTRLAENQTLFDTLETAPDKYGSVMDMSQAKSLDLSNSNSTSALNDLYHSEDYGEKLPSNFMTQSALPLDMKKAILNNAVRKFRFPNEFLEYATSSADFPNLFKDNSDANSASNKAKDMVDHLNFRVHPDQLNGITDFDDTGSGRLQGISGHFATNVMFRPDHHVVINDRRANLPGANRSPIVNTKYFKYLKGTPADRAQMAMHQAETALRIDDDTNTMLSTFGGYTFDDSTVISREYAERNPVNLKYADGSIDVPTQETIDWFNHELNQFVKSGFKNVGGKDWGPDSKNILFSAAQSRQAKAKAQKSLDSFLDSLPDQDVSVDDELNMQLTSNDDKIKSAAVDKYNDLQRRAKLSTLRQDIKLAGKGEDTVLDTEVVNNGKAILATRDKTNQAYDDFLNEYATTRPLTVHDKTSNFPGNKGIISLVVDRNMDPAEAKKQGLEKEVAIFKQNPSLDKIESPNSVVSRNNMSLVMEMKDKMGPEGPQNVTYTDKNGNTQIIGQMGHLTSIGTDILAESKVHIYNGDSQGRKFSGQLVWGLQQLKANHIVKEAFSDNGRAWHDYREYLMATGYDLSAMGEYQVGYHPHAGEHRKVFTLGDENSDPMDLSVVKDGNDFFRKMGSAGGMLKLPFEVKLQSGVKVTELPVLSPNLRRDTEYLDGDLVHNDFSSDYGSIVNAAQDYNKALKSGDDKAAHAAKVSTQQAIDGLQDKIIDSKLGGYDGSGKQGKFSFMRQHLIAKRLQKSATAVWSADSRVDLDTVKVSPEVYDSIGPRDDKGNLIPWDETTGRPKDKADFRTMLWRDPVLHGGSIRSFKLQVDPKLSGKGVSINPVNDNPFDGDFDGDTVGLMRFDSPESQKELQAMSVPNQLIAPHAEISDEESLVHPEKLSSELNVSMDFVAGFKQAIDDPSGEGIKRINKALGPDHQLTPEDLGQEVDENGHTTGNTHPIHYKKLLNKTLVSIALFNDTDSALAKSNDMVNLGMRDYNFGSAQMPYDSYVDVMDAVKFQQENGIKGKGGLKPVSSRVSMPVTDKNGQPVLDDKGNPKVRYAKNQDGSYKYKVDWVTPVDTQGNELTDYRGFSPKLVYKKNEQGLTLRDDDNNPIPERDKNGNTIQETVDGKPQWVQDTVDIVDPSSVDGYKTFKGQPSSVGKCGIYLQGLKDAKNDPKFGNAFANVSKDIQQSMGIKTDDTGISGTYSQKVFSVMRAIDPTAALELTYPLTQAVLQIKHDADKAKQVHIALNKSIRNLYNGNDKNFDGKNKKLQNIKPDEWVRQLGEVYQNDLNVPFDSGFAKRVAKGLTNPDTGLIMGTDEAITRRAAQLDVTSFGNGIQTIDSQAKQHANVMGPSNEIMNQYRIDHGYSPLFTAVNENGSVTMTENPEPMSDKDYAELLAKRSAINDQRPQMVDNYIKAVKQQGPDASAEKLAAMDFSLTDHGRDYHTELSEEELSNGQHEASETKVNNIEVQNNGQTKDQDGKVDNQEMPDNTPKDDDEVFTDMDSMADELSDLTSGPSFNTPHQDTPKVSDKAKTQNSNTNHNIDVPGSGQIDLTKPSLSSHKENMNDKIIIDDDKPVEKDKVNNTELPKSNTDDVNNKRNTQIHQALEDSIANNEHKANNQFNTPHQNVDDGPSHK